MARKNYLQLNRGHWFAVLHDTVYVDGRDVLKRRTVSLGVKGKGKRREAERALLALEQGNTKTTSIGWNTQVAAYFARHLVDIESTVRPWTLRTYRVYLGHFSDMFGHMSISSITAAHVEQWREHMLREHKASTVKVYASCVHAAFLRAIELGYIAKDPFRGVRPIGRTLRSKEFPPFWRRDQFDAFIETVPESKFRLAFCLAFYAGARLREAANLRWSDVKGDHIVITPHGHFRTKSGNTRKVPISDELRRELSKYGRTEGYVLESFSPLPNPDAITKQFLQKRKRFNELHPDSPLPEITFHGLRHSFATNLAPYVQLAILSKILGHTSLSTTQIYIHVQEDEAVKIAAKAMSILSESA